MFYPWCGARWDHIHKMKNHRSRVTANATTIKFKPAVLSQPRTRYYKDQTGSVGSEADHKRIRRFIWSWTPASSKKSPPNAKFIKRVRGKGELEVELASRSTAKSNSLLKPALIIGLRVHLTLAVHYWDFNVWWTFWVDFSTVLFTFKWFFEQTFRLYTSGRGLWVWHDCDCSRSRTDYCHRA